MTQSEQGLKLVQRTPAYSLTTSLSEHAACQTIQFFNAELRIDTAFSSTLLRQSINAGGWQVEVIYPKQDHAFVCFCVKIVPPEGASVEIGLEALRPGKETTFTVAGVTWIAFDIHPELDRHTRFGTLIHEDSAYTQEQFPGASRSFFAESVGFGFTISCSVHIASARDRLDRGFSAFCKQFVVLPTSKADTSAKREFRCMPYAIGTAYEEPWCVPVTKHISGIGISQIFGHGLAMLEVALALYKTSPDCKHWTFFVVPTVPIWRKLQELLRSGVPREWLHSWCYCREPGYGAVRLSLDPNESWFGATMLAFFSANSVLVDTLLQSVQGVLLFSDFSSDCGILRLLALTAGIRCVPIGKSLAILELLDCGVDAERPASTVLERIRQRAKTAVSDSSRLMFELSLTERPVRTEEVIKRKLFSLAGGVLLEASFCVEGSPTSAAREYRRFRIPHVSGARRSCLTVEEARIRVQSELLSTQTLQQKHPFAKTCGSFRLHVVALGSSPYVFREQLLTLLTEVAQRHSRDLFLVANEDRTSLINAIGEDRLSATENLIGIGWRNDICDVIRAADTYICRAGNLGSVCDGIAARVPMIMLPPEALTRDSVDAWAEVDCDRAFSCQVANETLQERTAVFLAVADVLVSCGVSVEALILDLALSPRGEQLEEAIEEAWEHRNQIAAAYASCALMDSVELLKLLDSFRTQLVSLD